MPISPFVINTPVSTTIVEKLVFTWRKSHHVHKTYKEKYSPKKAVTNSGAELPAAMNVAPATS